jgi:hypothetical protein
MEKIKFFNLFETNQSNKNLMSQLSSFGSDIDSDGPEQPEPEFILEEVLQTKTEPNSPKDVENPNETSKPIIVETDKFILHEILTKKDSFDDIEEINHEEDEEVPNSFDELDELTEESITKLLDSLIVGDSVLTDYNFLEFTTLDTVNKKLDEISM